MVASSTSSSSSLSSPRLLLLLLLLSSFFSFFSFFFFLRRHSEGQEVDLLRWVFLMAAEVSSLMRLLTRHDKDDGGGGGGGGGEGSPGGDLVTRDLLGGCGGAATPPPGRDGKELNIGLGSPSSAGENRLGVADLNIPPLCSSGFPPPSQPAAPQLRNLLPEHPAAALDLRLRPSATPPAAAGYQSVCTLEKVRSALERAQRESPLRKPPPSSAAPASPASSSTTTSSAKRLREAARDEEGERESKSPSSSSSSSSVVVQGGEDRGGAAAGMAAAGCPSCLLYVLISRSDPRCPRCNAEVPLLPPPGKRPRIDLNVSTSSAGAEPAAAANPPRTVTFF